MKHNKKRLISGILMFTLLLSGTALISYPTVADTWNKMHSAKMIKQYVKTVDDSSNSDIESLIESAVEYNRKLVEKQYPEVFSEKEKDEYESELDITGTGIMGYIDIPSIDCCLPVYHGTEGGVLQNAAGHLEWSSLPVGGKSTHAVISAHCGLPSAELFTRLEELEKGDVFQVCIADETLNYRVDKITVAEPDDTEELLIEEGEDYVTLLTCTPYGVNSHRLLVRGSRTTEMPGDREIVHIGGNQIMFLLALIILAAVLTVFVKNKKKEKKSRMAVYAVSVILVMISAAGIADIAPDILEALESEYTFIQIDDDNPFAENQDMAAWLKIDGTHIDYPVMQTDSDKGGEYYLHRNVNEEYDYRGVPFIDEKCEIDVTSNLIIYGHNMLDTTMFSELLKFENEKFMKKHDLISFRVKGEKEERTYRIFAACRLSAETDLWAYSYQGLLGKGEEKRKVYLEKIREKAVYYKEYDIDNDSQIMILSTCSYHVDNGRFILLAYEI